MSKADKHFGELGVGELRPGSTGRRWEPEGGINKLNKRIHKESKFADDHKNLPFSFRKPLKQKANNIAIKCNNCDKIIYGNIHTVCVICNSCGKLSKVSEV